MDEHAKYDKPAEHELTARNMNMTVEIVNSGSERNDFKPFRIDMFDIIKVMDTISLIIVRKVGWIT